MVFEKLQKVLHEALNTDLEDIKPESTLVGDLGAESIDFLDITFRIEREFNIKIEKFEIFRDGITIEELQKFSVQDLVNYLERKLK